MPNKDKVIINEQRRVRRGRNKEWILNYKKRGGCQVCEYNKHPEVLILHHIIPARIIDKKNRRHRPLGQRNISIETIKQQIKSYVVLCPTCHALAHYTPKRGYF